MVEEQFAVLPNGISLCYRDLPATGGGGAQTDPILMTIGLSFQLIHWPEPLLDTLRVGGHRVIVFDNRDSGKSTFPDGPIPGLLQRLKREAPDGAYDLSDMAEDSILLLDHLQIARAHVVGMSMGGMIAQVMAARNPDRVSSLTSIFSSTGARKTGQPGLRMTLQLSRKPAKMREDFIERAVQTNGIIGGSGYAHEPQDLRATFGTAWDRAGRKMHAGVGRQLGAIFASGDRTKELAGIKAPTLVLHGDRDPLVAPSGGTATAKAIPGARHVTMDGMGHDIPASLAPRLSELILEHVRSAQGIVA